jgi:hypothetical protein
MSLIKPLLKPEVAARFQFHTPDSDTIFQFIPKEMLPEGSEFLIDQMAVKI